MGCKPRRAPNNQGFVMCLLGAQPYIHQPPFHSCPCYFPTCKVWGKCASVGKGIYCGRSFIFSACRQGYRTCQQTSSLESHQVLVGKKNFSIFKDSQRPFLSKQPPVFKTLPLCWKEERLIIKATEEF